MTSEPPSPAALPGAEPAKGQTSSRAVASIAATQALIAVIALATGVLAARLLGPESRGHLAAAQAIGSLVGVVGAMALGEALVFSVGRRHRPPLVVLQTATVTAAASSVIVIGAAVLAMPWLLAGQPEAVAPARVYSLIGLTIVLLGTPIAYMRAKEWYGTWNRLRIIPPLCWLGALLLCTATRTDRVFTLIVAFLLAQSLFIPLVWHRVRRSAGTEAWGFDKTLVSPMLRYSAPLLFATLPLVLNARIDQLLIANIETADQLGLYAVSVSWAGLALPLLTAVGSVLFPKLAAMEKHEARAALGRVTRPAVIVAATLSAVSALTAPVGVPALFGPDFAVPVRLSVLLAAAAGILGVNLLIEEGLRGLGETTTVLAGELTGLAVTVASLVVLLPRLGIIGAAVASVAGYATVSATLAWRISRRIGLPVPTLLVPRFADIYALFSRLKIALDALAGRTRV